MKVQSDGASQRGPLDCRIKQKEENVMEETTRSEQNDALEMLCEQAKHMVLSGNIDGCYEMICHFMGKYPNAPHLHNLLGILSEKKGRHAEAMKHFRAALALDPTYSPASQNLDTYGSFYSTGRCAFHEADCIAESEKTRNTCASTGFIVRRAV